MKSIKIYFDLDGTVYNLYGINDWLSKLREEKVSVYTEGEKLFEESKFYKIVCSLLSCGVRFGVITWGSMTATPEFEIETENAKREWVKENLPFVESFAYQQYGTPKQQAIKNRTRNDILIDDNFDVLQTWINGKTRKGYQVTKEKDVTKILEEILEEILKEISIS
jgi:deoxyribodipyrimidine photolyase